MADVGSVGAPRGTRWGLRFVVLAYLALLLVIPVAMIFWRTFQDGVGPVWAALTTPVALHALQVTVLVTIWAVLLNTVFGLVASFLLVRHDFPGKSILDKLIDLPIAVSPVIVGLALILVYGQSGAIGSWLASRGVDIIFAVPGMVLATAFVSLPLVVREVAPILEEIGEEQEQAAATLGATPWQTLWRITLPAIRWGLLYGVVLTMARALGEFGAVAVVSGRVVGQTQTLTLFVDDSFEQLSLQDAYSGAVLLALIAVAALLLMQLFRPREEN